MRGRLCPPHRLGHSLESRVVTPLTPILMPFTPTVAKTLSDEIAIAWFSPHEWRIKIKTVGAMASLLNSTGLIRKSLRIHSKKYELHTTPKVCSGSMTAVSVCALCMLMNSLVGF